MKFRKKPVVIEAEQWFPGKQVAGVWNWKGNSAQDDYVGVCHAHTLNEAHCHTLEGFHVVSPGDWIITGIKGEKYPCKPDIFEATYERV